MIGSPPPTPGASPGQNRQQVTRLLEAACGGDPVASEQLFPLVYDDLRRAAAAMLAREPVLGANTLQPTALVHEAYLRLVGGGEMAGGGGAGGLGVGGAMAGEAQSWESRRHFFGAAARAMRRIIIDRARHIRATRLEQGAQRLGGMGGGEGVAAEGSAVSDPASGALPDRPEELLALDGALQTLAARDTRQHEVVMLRYFAGLTIEQTAQVLGVSAGTVKGDWIYARAWLLREVSRTHQRGGRE